MPGVTDAAGLVKVAGAENVLDFGMKTQQADRVAQQSAAAIDLTRKQIEQYDIDAKQREADEASGKALTTLVGNMYGENFTQEDLMTGLQGLSSSDAVRALNIYNERNPGEMLEQRTIGGRTFVYNTKTGATFDLGTGSELPEAYTKGLALIKEQFTEGTPEYNRAVQDLTDRTLGYDVTLGETAFGGQPAAEAAGPFAPTEAETVLFSRLPDNIFTEDNMVDSEKLEAELAKMDFLSPEEVERMRRFAASQSANRRRGAYLKATEEKPAEPVPAGTNYIGMMPIPRGGTIRELLSAGPGPQLGSVRPSYRVPSVVPGQPGPGIPESGGVVGAGRLAASQLPELGGPNVPVVRPSARVPAVVTGQPGPGIRGGMEATGRGRVAASQVPSQEVDFAQGPMATSAKRTIGPIVEDIKKRIEIFEDAGLSFSFNRAKKLAQERVRSEQGRNRKTVLKELKDIDLKRIGRKPKNASEAKAQSTMLEVLMEMLNMGQAPLVNYNDPRMQPQPLLPVE